MDSVQDQPATPGSPTHPGVPTAAVRHPTHRWGTALFCVLVFAAGLWLYTAHHDFPVEFHPDEPGKVYQTITRQFNFKHPQLLLTTSRFIRYVDNTLYGKGIHPYPQWSVVAIGRTVSAFFMAGAVMLLSLTALLRHGRLAGVACAALALITPQALAAGHYMKEDAGLLLGLCAWFLAFTLHARRPSWRTLAGLGLACGLAASGKYIGLLTVPVTLAILAWPSVRHFASEQHPHRIWCALSLCLGGALAVFCFFNYRIFTDTGHVLTGFGFEVNHMLTGHTRLRSDPLSPMPLTFLITELTWPIFIAGLAGAAVLARRFRRLDAGARLMLLMPLPYLVLVQFASLQEPRYVLPITLLLIFNATVGLAELSHFLPSRAGFAVAATLLGALLILPAQHAVTVLHNFATDNRYELRRWMLEHVDPDDTVVRDAISALPLNRDWHPARFRIEEDKYVGWSSFDDLQDRGVDVLVICDLAYSRYFESHRSAVPGEEAEVAAIRERYRVLLEDTPPLFERQRTPHTFEFSNPAVSVYRLEDVPSQHSQK